MGEAIKRKLLADLVKQYLPWNFSLAKKASEEALASAESTKYYMQALLAAWNSRQNEHDVKKFISGQLESNSSKSLLFLKLFLDPTKIKTKMHKKLCMDCFGAYVVEEAVRSKISDQSLVHSALNQFDKECFKHINLK